MPSDPPLDPRRALAQHTPRPPAEDGDANPSIPDVLTCEEAQGLVQRFASAGVSGRSLSSQEHQTLRRHGEGCPACSDHFAGVVGTLARLGHERRVTRVATEKAERRRSLRADVFDAQKPQRLVRGRLRALFYPALITFLLVALGQRVLNPLGAQVQAQGPEVWLRGQVLRPDHGVAQLRAGERLAVGPKGHADIQLGPTQWTLLADTEIRLEDFRPPSLRLFAGEIAVQGALCLFHTHWDCSGPTAPLKRTWRGRTRGWGSSYKGAPSSW